MLSGRYKDAVKSDITDLLKSDNKFKRATAICSIKFNTNKAKFDKTIVSTCLSNIKDNDVLIKREILSTLNTIISLEEDIIEKEILKCQQEIALATYQNKA